LQALKAVGDKTLAPLADGVAVARQLVGDLLVGGPVVACGGEDKAAAEGQGLGRGAGADEGFELLALFWSEHDA
jgi:hypothetical protein